MARWVSIRQWIDPEDAEKLELSHKSIGGGTMDYSTTSDLSDDELLLELANCLIEIYNEEDDE